MQAQPSFAPIAFGTNDVQIMTGTFDDFTFDDVIQVLSLSRQCLRFLVRRGEAAVSEVLLKAGQVLDARMPTSSEPEQVFDTLTGSAVRGSGLSFAVYHTQPTGPFPVPRARLADLYARAKNGAAARSAPVGEPTLRLAPRQSAQAAVPAAVPARTPVAAPAPAGSAPDHVLPTITLPPVTSDTLSKAMVADLQPLLRQEVQAAVALLREQSQTLHTLDGRLQALPQLVASEVRLALAQHERRSGAATPPVPAPAVSPALLVGLGAGVVVLVGVVVALVVTLLR